MRDHWVMDYETLVDCFVAVFEHHETEERHTFVVSSLRNDFEVFLKFLDRNIKNKEWHIGFNNLGFDAQVTHHIWKDRGVLYQMDGVDIAHQIYQYAQETIERSNAREFAKFTPWDMLIKQIDVYKVNHWDNVAKRSSLKWIQYSMDWPFMVEMPIHHTEEITSQADQDKVVSYCINDVASTKQIFSLSLGHLALRGKLTKQYGIDLYNASEPRIAKELFAHYLSEKLDKTKAQIKKLRTPRTIIKAEGLILPYIKFKTPEFNDVLEVFKGLEIKPLETKGGFKYSTIYKDVKTDFGLGGVHGCNHPGVYSSDADHIIMSSDVTSFYPNLAIVNKYAPAQLPKEEFCELYEWFFKERKKIPKSDPMNYVFKIILNSTYGLSNDKHSFLYDPQFTMFITLNGQLTLMMLYEMICEAIPESIPLMQNTDGLETRIPRDKQETYMDVCSEWERITGLSLEHDTYHRVVLADVNNYIGIGEDGKTKCKGRFEFENLALHKNKSKLVVPKVLYEYFVNGTPPEQGLRENTTILDYCFGSKMRGDWVLVGRDVDNQSEQELQKINRYYVSNSGVKLIKVNKADGREIQLHAGPWTQTLMNDIVDMEFDSYNVNTNYYLGLIEKEIKRVTGSYSTELTLF